MHILGYGEMKTWGENPAKPTQKGPHCPGFELMTFLLCEGTQSPPAQKGVYHKEKGEKRSTKVKPKLSTMSVTRDTSHAQVNSVPFLFSP